MARALVAITRLVHADKGQDRLEYGFVMALIAIVCMLAVTSVGDVIDQMWWGPIAGAF
jgi:Flp pilus assembly pilin Flp